MKTTIKNRNETIVFKKVHLKKIIVFKTIDVFRNDSFYKIVVLKTIVNDSLTILTKRGHLSEGHLIIE